MLIAIVDITKKHTTNVQKQDIQLLKAEIESTNTKYNKLTTSTITTKTYKIVNKLYNHLNCSLKIINSPL
jgi:hypothetical protein